MEIRMRFDTWRIEPFVDAHERQWDDFVMQVSLNGTFLHTRNFLNYHGKGKFIDASIEIYKGNKLVAVCPACLQKSDGRNILNSHKGSTFGGIVLHKDIYNAKDMMDLMETFENYLCYSEFDQVELKLTPDIFAKESMELLEYVLQYYGYNSYKELNSYIPLDCDETELIKKFDRNKKRNIKKCENEKLWFHRLDSDSELEQFYKLLEINLTKHNLKPIHSLNEILEFHKVRLKDETKFYGVGLGNDILAAGMMFDFKTVNIIHAQNLSYNPFIERDYSPISYLYYKAIIQAKRDGYKKLTWGVSTENKGKVLNMGLIRNKESYGSKYFLNKIYFKRIIK